MRISSLPCFLLVLGTAATAAAFTADELIAKNIEARGGRERLAALHSLKVTGLVTIGGGDDVFRMAYAEMIERPGHLRVERSIQGLTSVMAFDGETGWSLRPFGGRREPDKLPPDVVKSLKVSADIDGPLVDYQKKGHRVEYLGTEDVDGTEAHKLKVTLANGDTEFHYLDPDAYLEIRVLHQNKVRGVEEESETDFGNYERVAGVYIPFAVEQGGKGESNKGYKVTIEKGEANLPFTAELFRFPAPAPAAEPKR